MISGQREAAGTGGGACTTLTAPIMGVWTLHWYLNVPGVLKVTEPLLWKRIGLDVSFPGTPNGCVEKSPTQTTVCPVWTWMQCAGSVTMPKSQVSCRTAPGAVRSRY